MPKVQLIKIFKKEILLKIYYIIKVKNLRVRKKYCFAKIQFQDLLKNQYLINKIIKLKCLNNFIILRI